MTRILAALFFAVWLTIPSVGVAKSITDTYSTFWAFGDSLSDNGNLFAATGIPGAPYFNGRFSDGPVWNEGIINQFARENGQAPAVSALGLNTGNFAIGAALATDKTNLLGPLPGLAAQVGAFLTSTAVTGSNPLLSFWAGANDVFQNIDGLGGGVTAAREAADAVVGVIAALSANPVFDDFLVFNLPDLGLTPRFAGTVLQQEATDAAEAFNTRLDIGLAFLAPNINVTKIDVLNLLRDATANPGAFGVTNTNAPCIAVLVVCPTSLFFDDVHPTAKVHALIEAEVRSALAPVPLPAGGMLLVFAVATFGAVRRRKTV